MIENMLLQTNVRENRKGHPRMGNPEKPATLGTQEWAIQRNRQHWAHKNGQSRETGNNGHTRMGNPEKPEAHRTPKNGQSRESGNTGHTRHMTKTIKTKNTTQYTQTNTNNVNKI